MGKTNGSEVTYREFLSKAENIGVAVEVFDHFQEVRAHLQGIYWSAVRHFVENHISRPDFGKWKVTCDDVVTDEYTGIAFDLSKPSPSLYAKAYLQQGTLSRRFPLSLGIVWSEETPPEKEPALVELQTLRKHLREERGMTRPTHKWWIARGQSGYELHSAQVLTQLAKDKTIQQLQADEFVQFFLDTRKMVEQLNARIAKPS